VSAAVPALELGRETCGDYGIAAAREWLVTNGLGGYASGTVAGSATRRYHGLLVAALRPPVARTVALVKLDAVATCHGRRHALATNEYVDGTVHPCGHELLESFRLEGTTPVWTYAFADARLEVRVYMAHGRNTTYVRYTLVHASAPVELEIEPLCTWRDYHWHRHGVEGLGSVAVDGGCEVRADGGAFRVLADGAAHFEPGADWHWGVLHAVERARGLDDREDLFRPGRFRARLAAGESVAIVATTEPGAPEGAGVALHAVERRERGLLARVPKAWPAALRQLALAADQFVVARGSGGCTVIAGYPWFTDWGRDTMIALPGLALATGRPDVARDVLLTFAAHVDQGLLPNRFPDGDDPPEYNTVDATLWYFQAVAAYLQVERAPAFAARLYPVLADIVAWHDRGTRYGIAVDPADGLLRAGEPGVQLTWMDARVGDRVITPRTGKAVEINALWHGALAVLGDLAALLGHDADAAGWRRRAARVAAAFGERFWCESRGHLYDVIDAPDAVADATLRPNQLLACALRHELLDRTRTRAVVDACARELLTTFGLRTLPPGDPAYVGRYGGGPAARDAAYHQGTAWTWLLGAFVRAHLRAYGDADAARRVVTAALQHLQAGCVGQYAEIFDADPPHRPTGCFAQAWSVAELLTAWTAIEAHARDAHPVPTALEVYT
jgi:predicted glycogen debranching enzyme